MILKFLIIRLKNIYIFIFFIFLYYLYYLCNDILIV